MQFMKFVIVSSIMLTCLSHTSLPRLNLIVSFSSEEVTCTKLRNVRNFYFCSLGFRKYISLISMFVVCNNQQQPKQRAWKNIVCCGMDNNIRPGISMKLRGDGLIRYLFCKMSTGTGLSLNLNGFYAIHY